MNNDFCIEEEYEECLQEIKRLNNDIKILLKENEIKEKVILKQEEVINKAIEYIKSSKTFDDIETARVIDKYEKILLEILKGSDKE